ncbi:LacI family DNA-binding transcriptional regulator [Microbacterium sp. CIAB417]|uniref:LacI family DNA-binding transcriptional regulator n=1 Tax=Microbacterium sp. CIAB417 TaxID=2860287 RepID=UPI001FABE564|nr:LacI family DNA-binding transcriptional regulator [Microbacterium sp. CIAB417]
MATYKDLQHATGLSLATISKYYNGGTVRPENARAIEEAAKRLRYRPNELARNLRSGRSRTVGVLLPDLTSDFYLSILSGLERRLRHNGVSVLICADHADIAGSGDAVSFLSGRMVDGIITIPTRRAVPGLMELSEGGTPIVTLDWRAPGLDVDAVVIDNETAAATAIQHLIDHGHERIAYLAGDDTPTLVARLAGVRMQLQARRIPARDEYVISSPLSVEAGRSAMQRLLLLEERPTAVFVAMNLLGVGALTALNESGARVPGDMSFVGFDMPQIARMTRPALDTMEQDVDALAEAAADLMLARLGAQGDAGSEPVVRMLSARYIPGGSVADLRPPD